MIAFKSIIVMDLETTSLPSIDHNTTKITELAFVGCEIEHLKNSELLPRVLHKLVLLFNPNKTVYPSAADISGLTNELLMNLKPFRQEDVEVLREFINRLPSPVCLVAHNGDNFDFPILRRALVKVNKELQNNIYCVDSLKAFCSLLPIDSQRLWTRRPIKKVLLQVTPSTPVKRPEPQNCLQYKKVSRELFPEEEAFSKWASSQSWPTNSLTENSRTARSARLSDIYEYFFGGHMKYPHRAEEDSKALLSCIKRCDGFLEWMNNNAIMFNSIEPLF